MTDLNEKFVFMNNQTIYGDNLLTYHKKHLLRPSNNFALTADLCFAEDASTSRNCS